MVSYFTISVLNEGDSYAAPSQILMRNIVRQSLADRVYDHLIAALAARSLTIGSRLIPRTITDKLNVSRTTVTKAFDRLIQDGWIKADENGRTIVAAYPPRSRLPGPVKPVSFDFSNQTDTAYEIILERILRGDYAPGDILKERPVAGELGVNPATVRRAAEWLRNDGLLVRLPRRGWRIDSLNTRDVKDVYEIRLLLEPLVVAGTAIRITEQTLDELEKECDRLITAGEKATVYERRSADHRFHRVLSENSGSRVLAETLDPLVRKVLLITTVGFRFGRASRSFEEHKEIIRALRDRNIDQSVSRMKAHLRTALKFNLDAWERR